MTTTKRCKATPSKSKSDPNESLTTQFKELRMPTFRDQFAPMAARAEAENLSYLDYLSELTTLECQVRRVGRIKRLMTRSQLPMGKTWQSFDLTRLPMNSATAAGMKVTDKIIAPTSAATTVIAMGWNIFPSMPVRAKMGRYTTMMMS